MQELVCNRAETLDDAKDRIIRGFKEWLTQSVKKNKRVKWKGVHDEATYMTSWREYQLITGDPLVKEYAFEMLRKADAWMGKHFVNGYNPKAEVHHGVEHFIIFLAWLHELEPSEELHAKQLRDAAANITYRGSHRPPWYDPATNRFTSTHLGSRIVNLESNINIVEHLRVVRLAWLGLAAGGDKHLGTIIEAYSKEWAEQIVRAPATIPVYLDEFTEPDAPKREQNARQFQASLSNFIGAAPKEMTDVTRAEIHVANGTPDLFFSLHEATGNAVFLDAAERIILPVLGQLNSPYAHPVPELAWHLHRIRHVRELDAILHPIKEAVDGLDVAGMKLQVNKPVPGANVQLKNTIGFRKDMPTVEVSDARTGRGIPVPGPATLGLLYRWYHDERYLIIALEYARAVLLEARRMFDEGRRHGCSAQMVHSFCVGHGRNWGAGYTSTALRCLIGEDERGISLPKMTL